MPNSYNSAITDAPTRASITRPHAEAWLRADAQGRDGGVRDELAAGAILVCAANRPIGENNSSLEMARVDERTLDNNSLRILTLSYARKRHRPDIGFTSSASPNARDFAERCYGISGGIARCRYCGARDARRSCYCTEKTPE